MNIHLKTILVLLLAGSEVSLAETLSADTIISRAEKNGAGFKDMSQRLAMKIVEQDGSVSESEMTVRVLAEADRTKSLTLFTKPTREKGIGLLSHSMKDGSSKQWLYLPSSKRVKKIAAGNRESNFRGSEFTFEDMAPQERSSYRFELIGETPCGTLSCYTLDRFPIEAESAYSRTRLMIDTTSFLPRHIDFYDKKEKLLKSLNLDDYRKHDDAFWKPEHLRMLNVQNGRATELNALEVQFNTGLSAALFTEVSLRSGN